jgi:regulator of protease activity HflC (stomatin/prohibitin superfamily)
MVPIVLSPRRQGEKAHKEGEPDEKPAQRRERKREEDANLRRHVNGVSLAAMLLAFTAGILSAVALRDRPGAAAVAATAGALAGIFLLYSLKIARQWERAVVLRFGRFAGLRGPGLFAIVPVVETVSHLIDQRVRVTDVTAESALTRDTVPVNVDAIVFWTVWDAEKSVLEVADYFDAVSLSAQTALREAIGRHLLAEMITEREKLGRELQGILDSKTNPWGITVHSVEIRDVRIPRDLEDAMSRQAQAERERQARIILGTAETEIAARFVKAGDEYVNRPVALHLRAMNMLYEAIKEKGSMVIVPSSAVETMGLGGLSGLTALGRTDGEKSGQSDSG